MSPKGYLRRGQLSSEVAWPSPVPTSNSHHHSWTSIVAVLFPHPSHPHVTKVTANVRPPQSRWVRMTTIHNKDDEPIAAKTPNWTRFSSLTARLCQMIVSKGDPRAIVPPLRYVPIGLEQADDTKAANQTGSLLDGLCNAPQCTALAKYTYHF